MSYMSIPTVINPQLGLLHMHHLMFVESTGRRTDHSHVSHIFFTSGNFVLPLANWQSVGSNPTTKIPTHKQDSPRRPLDPTLKIIMAIEDQIKPLRLSQSDSKIVHILNFTLKNIS